MKVLISTIGSRGEVQPILGLATALRALGHEATLCMPPNFAEWVASFGFASVPIGPDVKKLTAAGAVVPASKDQKAHSASGTVVDEFSVLTDAARGHALLVGTGALQIAARSVAEALGIPHVFAAYCPVDFSSAHHPPPTFGGVHHSQTLPESTNRTLWDEVEQRWNTLFPQRAERGARELGRAPSRVRGATSSPSPWLAADPFLAPLPSDVVNVVQTGAWRLADPAPLPSVLEDFFLSRGDAPAAEGEIPTAEAGRRKRAGQQELRSAKQARGPQHEVKPAASTDEQSESRAGHFAAKATSTSRAPERDEDLGGVLGAARVQGSSRNTRDPSPPPLSRLGGSNRPKAKDPSRSGSPSPVGHHQYRRWRRSKTPPEGRATRGSVSAKKVSARA